MKRECEMAYCYSQIIWTRGSPQFHDAQCKLVSPPVRRFPFLMGAPQWSCKWDYMWTNGAVRRRQRRPHIAALQAVDGRSSCSSSTAESSSHLNATLSGQFSSIMELHGLHCINASQFACVWLTLLSTNGCICVCRWLGWALYVWYRYRFYFLFFTVCQLHTYIFSKLSTTTQL